MQIGRLITFTLGVIGFGLLQLWVLIMILNTMGSPIDAKEILGDGGLFFFSTSLAVGSAITLFDTNPLKIGSRDCNVTIIVCGGVLLLTVVYYSAVLSQGGLKQPDPFAQHILLQIGCSLIAIGYWFYMGISTGLFVKKE
ncbi:MAG: hypothetical protein IH984_14980 [Planctomycetes bacterium]|nr:hypothetical protein [Planctomycetota bacterium]